MNKTYTSKVSYGLLGFIFLVFYGPLTPGLFAYNINGKTIGVFAFLTLVFGFIAHLFMNTNYSIENENLIIKCGFFTYKPIAIKSIKKITRTKSIISSPAPSFDRLEIAYGKFDSIIISPKDKAAFTRDLVNLNPNIINNVRE